MFGNKKSDKTVQNSSITTKSDKMPIGADFSIIGENMTIKGEISSNGNIRVDGRIEGNVTTKAKLILGPKGFIEGNVTAKLADIEGVVHGMLEISELLTLKATSTVQGEVRVGSIAVEQGAKFDAVCKYIGFSNKPQGEKMSVEPNKS